MKPNPHPADDRCQTITLELRPLVTGWRIPAEIRLRAALKPLLVATTACAAGSAVWPLAPLQGPHGQGTPPGSAARWVGRTFVAGVAGVCRTVAEGKPRRESRYWPRLGGK